MSSQVIKLVKIGEDRVGVNIKHDVRAAKQHSLVDEPVSQTTLQSVSSKHISCLEMQASSVALSEVDSVPAVSMLSLPPTLNTIYRENLIYQRKVQKQVRAILAKNGSGPIKPTVKVTDLPDEWDITKDTSVDQLRNMSA